VGEYRKLTTPLGHQCEIREVAGKSHGRRWHVRVKGSSFHLWADRYLPTDATEERIWRGVLNGVDDELVRDRSKMDPDYEAPLVPQNFE
jgi:hypothetical protein